MPDLGFCPRHVSTCAFSPAALAQRTTWRASPADALRKPWSTVSTTGAGHFLARANAASRCISARESPPPDTATAQCEAAGASWAAIASANFSASLFAGGFAEVGRLAEDLRAGVRIFRLDEAKRGAAFGFLTHRHERLGELEHSLGCRL